MKKERKTKTEIAFISLIVMSLFFSLALVVSFFVFREVRVMEMALFLFSNAITSILGFLFGSKH
ncbi:MAG: hypothetical protein LBG88_03970 [Christensenellaceae bacterium]|jgi:hypothetical protein|nr:hypothetical protein [Christensenellaceae bacterium]